MKCPTCGADGDYLVDAPKAERFHFFQRVKWGLHKIRLTFRRPEQADHAIRASDIIRVVERFEDDTKKEDTN